jgi:hypothetical protein
MSHTNSTKKFPAKTQTLTSSKICPKFESESYDNPKFKLALKQNTTSWPNKNCFRIPIQYSDQPNSKISKIWIFISCEHLIKQLAGKNQTKSHSLFCTVHPCISDVPMTSEQCPRLPAVDPLSPLPKHRTWDMEEKRRTPQPTSLSPSEPDHPDLSHRARTHLQHTAARSTRQRRPSSLP